MNLYTNTTLMHVNDDLSLTVFSHSHKTLWESSRIRVPTATVRTKSGECVEILLSSAECRETRSFGDGRHVGETIRLSRFAAADVILDVTFAVDADSDELFVSVEQAGGSDTVVSIDHFYRFEKPVADGGHMILPHGSGYLIPADCKDELPGRRDLGCDNNRIGDRWTLPMFGLVRGESGMCIVVDTWWDCEVREEHVPGDYSALDMCWIDSFGKLDYPRRFTLRFAEGMDYPAMAKIYRQLAAEQGLLRTLAEKAEQTPVIRDYVENTLLRWPAWNAEYSQKVLDDIRRFRESGFGVNFFFPKWSSLGYCEKTGVIESPEAGWQAYLLDDPVPGGWPTLVRYADDVHRLGCPIQLMITMPWHFPDAPGYDESRWPRDAEGNIAVDTSHHYGLGGHDATDRLTQVLDNLEKQKLTMDVLYFDGYAAFAGVPVDYSPGHPMTRRANFEMQNRCFSETRRRGIMPSGELARFWCIADCDYFFYTDWSADRLVNTANRTSTAPVGQPIPLFQLVFHDCYMAGFSGGGYAEYSPGVDWWEDYTPRLYELMFASAPAYNWLPKGRVPISDWDSDRTSKTLSWLKRWSTYYRATAISEMVSHKFLSADRTVQRVEFANGVWAEFDMPSNRFRISGVEGFSGKWENPEDL